jgi:hypothetical protein
LDRGTPKRTSIGCGERTPAEVDEADETDDEAADAEEQPAAPVDPVAEPHHLVELPR